MTVLILLGSNEGNRKQNLELACKNITQSIGIIRQKSSIYQTAAWGNTDQPDFFNMAIHVSTTLSPTNILSLTQTIENKMGRIRKNRWEQRIIDIDILYIDEIVLQTQLLTIPHPQIPFRRFTLIPLVEIAPYFSHPVLQKTNFELLQQCTDPLRVSVFTG